MALDKRLQNPKRSAQDPTELEARLAAMEERLAALEKRNNNPILYRGRFVMSETGELK
jgi:hypothetical protein